MREHVRRIERHDSDSPPSLAQASALQQRLENDPRVVADSITGKNISSPSYSPRFLDFLATATGFTDEVRTPSRLPMNAFQYGRDLQVESNAYSLGCKFDSTTHALVGLAARKTLPTYQWDLHVYDELHLVTVGSGGNHRSLACLLWGQHSVPLETIHITRPTGLGTERVQQAIKFEQSVRPHGFIQLSLKEDRMELLRLFDSSTEEERKQLAVCCRHANLERDGERTINGCSPAFAELWRCLDGIRALDAHKREPFLFRWSRRRERSELTKRYPMLRWIEE